MGGLRPRGALGTIISHENVLKFSETYVLFFLKMVFIFYAELPDAGAPEVRP